MSASRVHLLLRVILMSVSWAPVVSNRRGLVPVSLPMVLLSFRSEEVTGSLSWSSSLQAAMVRGPDSCRFWWLGVV